ncbi:type IV toxin-antitoxin system AbiEi family antitoxin domain-containing protein [Chromobacterium haemolyticum]|uniref:type IV toxin-antitoxin system AbiEi family antitoxin domain-containing protein n=1 Tax=Chromobacterium haemolyticum TaxID=394935 RepID=UPI0005B8CED7
MANRTAQHLMQTAPHGLPIDIGMLRDFGVYPAQATYMVKAGRLQRLSHGIYYSQGTGYE